MPKYSYKCQNCGETSTFYHSISDMVVDCELCNSKSTLQRLPSKFSLFKEGGKARVGSVVKRSIEEFREDLEQEKRELKDEIFDPDE